MKKRLSLLCLTLAILAFGAIAEAQNGQPYPNSYGGPGGGPGYSPGEFQPTSGDLRLGLPGRTWFETSFADRGLGYVGSYLTFGAKNRLFEDSFDGRWLGEMRLHQSLKDGGGFFANFGLERVFTLDAANSDLSLGLWLDFDGDGQASFSNDLTQWGVSGKIKTRRWDFLANGYISTGNSDFSIGDPTGGNVFYENRIVIQPGIDSQLEGFDAVFRSRPEWMANVNGSLDIGGYGYRSELVEFFGGGRVGIGAQMFGGMLVNARVNYDSRFNATGFLSVGWAFGGGNVRSEEYAGLGRDLEETVRNDHIVRYQQELIVAFDPDTGLPYNVWHVNNSALAPGSGDFEMPFMTLAEAEAASAAGDIIFVNGGDGTATGMSTGIVLKDDQLFLGGGVDHLIPVQGGMNFLIPGFSTGSVPTISGSAAGNAVTLGDNNVVRGFNIDGTAGVGGMANGIAGTGVDSGIIEDVIISDAILNGFNLQNATGDWNIARNTIAGNGFDGILIENSGDPTSIFNFDSNNVSGNGRDGIHMLNYDAAVVSMLSNITDNNFRHGVNLDGYVNGAGLGLDLDFLAHSGTGNNGDAIRVVSGDGDLRVVNSSSTANAGNGLTLIDWTTTNAADSVFVGTTTGGTSSFSNNGSGYGIYNELNAGTQRFTVTDTVASNNLNGVGVRTTGVATNVISSIVDNVAFSNNAADGLRFLAESGSTQSVLIDQPASIGSLGIAGNGANGVNFQVGNASMGTLSAIDAVVRNVTMNGNGNGLFVSVLEDGAATILVQNSTASGNGNGISMLVDTNDNGALNRLIIDNVAMNGNVLDAVDVTTLGGSLTDIVIADSTFNGGGGSGVNVNAFGSPVIAGVDNMTRLTMSGNAISNFTAGGVDAIITGDANFLADIRGNSFTGNTGGGVNLSTADDSRADIIVNGNTMTGNGAPGMSLLTAGDSTINALWINNAMSGNTGAGATATNAPMSNICLAMSSNFFSNGFTAVNNAAAVDFVVELDGFTNGFGPGALPGNVTVLPFGSTCEPAIALQQAAFNAAGFPDIN